MRRVFKRSAVGVLATGVGVGLFYALGSKETKNEVKNSLSAGYRISNLGLKTFMIALDYGFELNFNQSDEYKKYQTLKTEMKQIQTEQEKLTFKMWQDHENSSHYEGLLRINREKIEKLSKSMSQLNPFHSIHQRNARRLRNLCIENKGVYIKIGQHISMLDHIVPLEYQEELSLLLANNPHSSFETVQRVIETEFQKPINELFADFQTQPIASASLAQVHIAYDRKTGKKLAVKVQHEGLGESAAGDLKAITFIVDLLAYFFQDFDYRWLTRESNKNLPLELDFLHEIENVERTRELLHELILSGDLVLPLVYPSLSSSKVLTMSFEEGKSVTNRQEIEKMGLNPVEISKMISVIFCEQMYRHGFVHCDPHEANILVRRREEVPDAYSSSLTAILPASILSTLSSCSSIISSSFPSWMNFENQEKEKMKGKEKGRPQIVLLDHGLYQSLSTNFRRDYCRLWRALVCFDEEEVKLRCEKLNAKGMFTLLAAILTMRPWTDISANDFDKLQSKDASGDSAMLQAYAQKYFTHIVSLLGRVPSELLLLLKTNDCLRHLDRKLGTPYNNTAVIASITADVILQEDLNEAHGWGETLRALRKWAEIQWRLLGIHALSLFCEWDRWFRRTFL